MATIPASENIFPVVQFAEGAAPSTPATGNVRLYAKSDGLLYWKDDAGTEYTVGTGDTAGHIADTSDAHDASAVSVLDTAANFTGTDVEAVLAELQDNIDGVSGGISSGTSFPGSPADNDLFYRTDLPCGWYRYESTGTKWLCSTLHDLTFLTRQEMGSGGYSATTNTIATAPTNASVGDMWIEKLLCTTFVNTTSSGTQFWTGDLYKLDSANSATLIGQVSTVSNAANTWVEETDSIDEVVVGASFPTFRLGVTKTSTPGALFIGARVLWRHCVDV